MGFDCYFHQIKYIEIKTGYQKKYVVEYGFGPNNTILLNLGNYDEQSSVDFLLK